MHWVHSNSYQRPINSLFQCPVSNVRAASMKLVKKWQLQATYVNEDDQNNWRDSLKYQPFDHWTQQSRQSWLIDYINNWNFEETFKVGERTIPWHIPRWIANFVMLQQLLLLQLQLQQQQTNYRMETTVVWHFIVFSWNPNLITMIYFMAKKHTSMRTTSKQGDDGGKLKFWILFKV